MGTMVVMSKIYLECDSDTADILYTKLIEDNHVLKIRHLGPETVRIILTDLSKDEFERYKAFILLAGLNVYFPLNEPKYE